MEETGDNSYKLMFMKIVGIMYTIPNKPVSIFYVKYYMIHGYGEVTHI